jgi:hypothetical protein
VPCVFKDNCALASLHTIVAHLLTYTPAVAWVTTSSHLHNHTLAGHSAQASVVTQQFDGELISSIERWAQCGLATKVIRQLVQLELSVPFLTVEAKKKVHLTHDTHLRKDLMINVITSMAH